MNRRDAFKGITLTIAGLCTGKTLVGSTPEKPVLENQIDFQALLKNNPEVIQFISNPSKELQILAIEANPLVVQYIKDLSEELQLLAVGINGSSIQYIENPSDKVKLAAIEERSSAIQYIENPTQAMKLNAVEKYPPNIVFIKNPDEELLMIVAKKCPKILLKDAKNLSSKVRLECIKTDVRSIALLPNVTNEELWLAARTDTNCHRFRQIKFPHEIVDYFLQNNKHALEYLAFYGNYEHPEILKRQVEVAAENFEAILHPCEAACLEALKIENHAHKWHRMEKMVFFVKKGIWNMPNLLSKLKTEYYEVMLMLVPHVDRNIQREAALS